MGFLIFLLIWLVSGVLAYGFTLAFFQGRYPTVRDAFEDFMFAVVIGLTGPIGLLASVLVGDTSYGLKFHPEGPTEDRW